jgi:uncharacterized protein YciI
MLSLKLSAAAVAVALVCCGAMAGQAPQPSREFPDIPQNLKPYFVALYVKGAKADQPQTNDEHNALIRQHLAYMRSQVEAGKYLLAGPFMDDDRVRGIAVIRAASAEEARQVATADPAIQSGRMAIEIHPAVLPDMGCVRVEYQGGAGK